MSRKKPRLLLHLWIWLTSFNTGSIPRQCLASRLHDNPVESSVRDNQAGLDDQADSPGPAPENDKVQVEQVNPDLVTRDDEGKPYGRCYEAVNAMLLNEFLKEHRKVQGLQKQVEKLTAGLQKVSDGLELRKSAPQVVDNTR
jgi:hypothetical protein